VYGLMGLSLRLRRAAFAPCVLAMLSVIAVACAQPTPTPEPTATPELPLPTPTPTATATPTPTATPTLTPLPTATPTPTLTPTPSPTPTPRPSPTPTPTPLPTSFGPGTWRVGVDIAPGTYEAVGVSGRCEWARLSRLDDFAPAVLFGGNTTRPAAVAILPTDAGFRASEACGRWSLRSPPTPTPSPTPVPPLSLSFQPTTISSGHSHTCALRPNGTPVCWGDADSSPPRGERFASISSGSGGWGGYVRASGRRLTRLLGVELRGRSVDSTARTLRSHQQRWRPRMRASV